MTTTTKLDPSQEAAELIAAVTETITIFPEELGLILRSQKGAKIVSVITETDPGKSNKHKGICRKRSHVNGVINWHYAKAINRQREREGKGADFEVQPRKWGERIAGTPLVHHKGKYYLELKVENVYQTDYFMVRPGGELVPTTRDEIADHIRPSRSASNQQLTKEVILRDYKLDSIVELRMSGKVYKVVR